MYQETGLGLVFILSNKVQVHLKKIIINLITLDKRSCVVCYTDACVVCGAHHFQITNNENLHRHANTGGGGIRVMCGDIKVKVTNSH